jgi:alpha-L-fucosidase 2
MKQESDSQHVIWSPKPAGEWAEGYPIGNGRLGGMVLGDPLCDRVGLNHDRLWRNFWSYQEHHTAEILPQMRQLCLDGKWDDAHDLLLTRIPASGAALYVNPLVPACDLGIFPFHGSDPISDYHRQLDMDTGIVTVSYTAGGIRYTREYFSSWPAGVMVIRLSAGQAARIRGEVTLSRLLDPDCLVTGNSKLGEVVLQGEFEEGVRFATVIRVVQRGGRLTGGRTEYQPPVGQMPPKDLNGLQFIFREKDPPGPPMGVSTCFDCADEVLLLVAIGTEDESNDPLTWCREKLASVPTEFSKLSAEHIWDHQQFYRRVSLTLVSQPETIPAEELVKRACDTGTVSPALIEKLFNIGRYTAITSGRPAPKGQPSSAPITLQGIWNQDRHPAWDCDYHLDLNLEMCYWPLEMVNLPELIDPVTDWIDNVLPEARLAAKDLFDCRGAHLCGVADLWHLGNVDDLCFGWIGSGGWMAQILWHHWEYTADVHFLKDKLYPFLKEVGQFYEDYLIEDNQGRLIPVPSDSPEMGIKGRRQAYSSLSSPSTMDLELIREIFSHLLTAGAILGMDSDKWETWRTIHEKVPMPVIDQQGVLQEWLEDHEPIDQGHRHRSPFVQLCPGDRITLEDTPDYLKAARKLLEIRHSTGRKTSVALAMVWDAQILDRCYEGDTALDEINFIAGNWLIDNLLLSHCDWRENTKTMNWFPGKKIFQIEASIGMVAAISEMFFQDRRGLLRVLPALPAALPEGQITGLRARGGFEVDISWSQGRLVEARITSLRGNMCRVKVFSPGREFEVVTDNRRLTCSQNSIVEFDTQIGKQYYLRGI